MLAVLGPTHRRAREKELTGVAKDKKVDSPVVAVSETDKEVETMPLSSRHAHISIRSPSSSSSSSSARTPQPPDTQEREISDEIMDNHSTSSPATMHSTSPPTQPSCPPPAAASTTTVNTASSTQRSSTGAARGDKEVAAGPSSQQARCDDGDGAVGKSEGQEEENAARPSSSSRAAGSATTPTAFSDQRDGGSGTHINVADAQTPPRARFDIFDEGLDLEGTTPVASLAGAETAAVAEAADVVRPPDLAATIGPDFMQRGPGHPLGAAASGVDRSSGGGVGYGGGAPTMSQEVFIDRMSTSSQVLHMVMTFAVFVVVVLSKSGDGVVSGCKGGSSAPSSSRRSARSKPKQRRRTRNGMGFFSSSSVRSWPLVRFLRAAWSKLWHAVENSLASRWRAAGQALVSLRQAWAALWVSPPHAEAHILAKALASLPRYRRAGRDRRRRVRGGTHSSAAAEHEEDSPGGAVFFPCGGEDNDFWAPSLETNCLNFLRLCGYRPLAGTGSRARKFLLLLDLDETLVHCSQHLMEPARRRSGGAVRPDLQVEFRGRAQSNRPACMYAWKRPHLDVFLSVVSRWYDVGVFTAGRQCVAEAVIDLIDHRCLIGKRFYRDSCTRRDGGGGKLKDSDTTAGPGSPSEIVKDLRVVNSEQFPLRTVLVDNQPRTVVQQANVLPVRSWFPGDLEDRQLLELLPVLLALTSCQDVRSVLGLRPGVAREGASVTP